MQCKMYQTSWTITGRIHSAVSRNSLQGCLLGRLLHHIITSDLTAKEKGELAYRDFQVKRQKFGALECYQMVKESGSWTNYGEYLDREGYMLTWVGQGVAGTGLGQCLARQGTEEEGTDVGGREKGTEEKGVW